MQWENRPAEGRSSGNKKPYDLTGEASKRGRDKEAMEVARTGESDDSNEETHLGYVSGPEGDEHGKNKVATSLSEA